MINSIELVPIKHGNPQLAHLFGLYVDEMLNYVDQSKAEPQSIDPSSILDKYWAQQAIWPYLIEVEGEVAGFCLLRLFPTESDTIDIDQFFVLGNYRRKGLGAFALREAIVRHPGKWLIRVLKANTGAYKFWSNAVRSCQGSDYRETDEDEQKYFIRFETCNEMGDHSAKAV